MARTPGSRNLITHRQPKARDRIWASMRIMVRFSIPELVATAETTKANAAKYVRGLAHAGYLRVVAPKRNGAKGGHAVYQLIRNTGPRAPRLTRDGQTFDMNERQFHAGGIKQ